MPHVFTLPEILSLARKPEAGLARDDSDGFSYPQRGWMYVAATEYYESGRNPSAVAAGFERAVLRGRGLSPGSRERRQR